MFERNRFNEKSKNSRNSRIDSLCSQIGIQDRRYDGNIFKIDNEIEYSQVDDRIEYLRQDSREFLKKALEKE